jgi:hypothetical protein
MTNPEDAARAQEYRDRSAEGGHTPEEIDAMNRAAVESPAAYTEPDEDPNAADDEDDDEPASQPA